jgi:hypothetical protein
MCATQGAHTAGTHFMSENVSAYVTGPEKCTDLWLCVCLLNYMTETSRFVIRALTAVTREKKLIFISC